jgi:hypothetical protein
MRTQARIWVLFAVALIAYFIAAATERGMALNVVRFPRDGISHGLEHRSAAPFGSQMETSTVG